MTALDELLQRASSVRWLDPDAKIESLDDEARGYIAERIDEHTAALQPYLQGESVPAGFRISRSMYEVYFATIGSRSFRSVQSFSPAAQRWLRALEAARTAAIEHVRRTFSPAVVCSVAELVWDCFRSVPRAPSVRRKPLDFTERLLERIQAAGDSLRPVPGGEVWLLEALLLASGEQSPRPWHPLMALWERGMATLAGLDGQLVVYVPVRSEGEVLAEPEPSPTFASNHKVNFSYTPEEKLRLKDSYTVFYGGARMDTDERDPSTGRTTELEWWATQRRFHRMGLGPVFGMLTERIDTSFNMVVSNSPFVRPSLFVTTIPEVPWTEKDARAWLFADENDVALLQRSTPVEKR